MIHARMKQLDRYAQFAEEAEREYLAQQEAARLAPRESDESFAMIRNSHSLNAHTHINTQIHMQCETRKIAKDSGGQP